MSFDLDVMSHQQIGHTEMGFWFKVLFNRPEWGRSNLQLLDREFCALSTMLLWLLCKQEVTKVFSPYLTLLHSERPKLHRVLAVLSAIGLNESKKHTHIETGLNLLF